MSAPEGWNEMEMTALEEALQRIEATTDMGGYGAGLLAAAEIIREALAPRLSDGERGMSSEYLTAVDYDTPSGGVLRNLEDHLADFHSDNAAVLRLVMDAVPCDRMAAERVVEAIREHWLHEYDRNPYPG